MPILNEVRLALRQLRKNPGFTALCVLTLGLGVGAATAVFSLVDTVLLRPLPFAQPERIVALDTLSVRPGRQAAPTPNDTSYPNFFDWRAQARSFDAMASWQSQGFTLGTDGSPASRIVGMTVAADFFRVLGVQPALGRTFERSEEQAGNRSVIIGDELWKTAFARDPAVLGKTLRLSDELYTVVGVLPAGFHFPTLAESAVWVTPAQAMEGRNPSGQQRGWNQLNVLARLAPGVSLEAAHDEMQTIQLGLARQYPDEDAIETAVSVKPVRTVLLGDYTAPLGILFGAVCVLLAIACTNVAGLLLTRSTARRAEMALRVALGASRTQIVRQMLVEALMLSLAGGALGFALAAAVLRTAPRWLPADLPRAAALGVDARIFLFALAVSVATGLVFGVVPAWRNARLDPAQALGESSRTSTASRGQNRLHNGLIVAETALGLMLLIGAGLLIHSFSRLLHVDAGFDARNLVTFRVGIPPKRYREERMLALAQRLQARFAALPGVRGVALAYPMPLTGSDMSITFDIVGRPAQRGNQPSARLATVDSGYFHTLGIPLRRGRLFSAAEDHAGGPLAVVVNQAFADRYFPGEDPVGKSLLPGVTDNMRAEIVGVVGNVQHASLAETPAPQYYMAYAQTLISSPMFAMRVEGDPTAFDDTLRRAAAEIDPELPVYAVRTDLLAGATVTQRFQTGLLTAFAVIALMLAAVGLYGLLSYSVAQRRMELGLRMALGAQRGDVLTLVMRRGLALCLMGLAAGLVASAVLSRTLSTLLFHTGPLDPASFALSALLLLTVSAAACLLPAWRASRLDPNQTLREQ